MSAGVHAEVSVGGDVLGQIAVGNNILQVGSVHGDLITVAPPGGIAELVPRRSPVKVVPREPEPFFGRQTESALLVAEAGASRAIAVEGPRGIGRSTLLRHVATDAGLGSVAFLSTPGSSLEDAARDLVDHFYRSDMPVIPTSAQARSLLQQISATIVVDDVAPAMVRGLIDLAPNCGFVVAPTSAVAGVRPMTVGGLAADEARALFAYSLGRPLQPDERAAADRLCVYAANSPTRIIATAALVLSADESLEAFADEIWTSGVSSGPRPADGDTRLVDLLAAIPNLVMPESWLSALTQLPDLAAELRPWVAAGLVREAPDGGYRLAEKRPVTPAARAAVVAHAVDATRSLRDRTSRPDPITAALHAVLADCTQHGDWQAVLDIGAALDPVYAQSGRWDAWRDVLAPMLTAARALGNRAAEARALHQLGTRELCLLGAVAAGLLAVALRIRQSIGDTAGAAVTQHNIALLPPAPITGPDVRQPRPRHHPRHRLRIAAAVATAAVAAAATTVTIVLTNSSPAASFTTASIGFADRPVSAPGAAETATLVNNGRTTAHIAAPRIDGDDPADFSITATTCGAVLPGGASCETTVAFTPTGEGTRIGLLAVDLDDGSIAPVSLTGTGTHPTGLVVNPTAVEFPALATGAIVPAATITVTHPDPGSTTVRAIELEAGPAAAEFSLANDTGTGRAVASQDRCTVDISVIPTGADEPITHVQFLATDGTVASVPVHSAATDGPTTRPSTKPPVIPPVIVPPVVVPTVVPALVAQIVVPPVVGKLSADAGRVLTAAGLRAGAESQAPSGSAVGTVLGSDPVAGTAVAPGTGVALVVSSGPQTCQVPDVTGQTAGAATSTIKETCAVVGSTTTETSNDAPPNTVLRTSPPAGSEVTEGSVVRLIVAKQDEVAVNGVTVPSVIGESRLDAKATLESKGLSLGGYTPTDDNNENPAVGQQPGAGEMVPAGSNVTVTFKTPTQE